MRAGAAIRATAFLSTMLWAGGTFFATHATATPPWTKPHCPVGLSSSTIHGHCSWHCQGIDSQTSDVQATGVSALPDTCAADVHQAVALGPAFIEAASP